MNSNFSYCSFKGDVSILNVDKNGSVSRKTNIPSADVCLCRNEHRDILLKVAGKNQSWYFPLKHAEVRKRFLKEGKMTFILNESMQHIFLSNCPPKHLSYFVKLFGLKRENSKNEKCTPLRQRFLTEKCREVTEISPLTAEDIKLYNLKKGMGTKLEDNSGNSQKTPGKRKLDNDDKENTDPRPKVLRSLNPNPLTEEQRYVLNVILSGKSIFFTGCAGTGKSFLLKRIVGALPPETTFVAASTGVAASHIGGMTLHAFAGIGKGSAPIAQCIEKVLKSSSLQQWKKCCCLIIDEISMVDGNFFEKLERVARVVRRNDKPFGGIQLVLCGDFFQLPPVTKHGETRKFCFQTSTWDRCIHQAIELKQVHRQKDIKFVKILQQIRFGRCPDSVEDILLSTRSNKVSLDGIVATKLSTHNDDVDYINENELKKLSGKLHTFTCADSDATGSAYLDAHCPRKIELKVGSQVMLTKNTHVQSGLANGARGVIVEFNSSDNGLPVVKFCNGLKKTIKYERWIVKGPGGQYLVRKQLPLRLAWAMSIHRSQGLTLDAVELSLSRVFESGQAYVALSRASGLKNLRIIDFNKNSVRADPDVVNYYETLRTQFYES